MQNRNDTSVFHKMVGFSKWRLLACSCLIFFANKVSSSQDVMKKLTTGFVKTLMECKNELNLPDHIIQDLYNFWREDYQLLNRDVGCAIMCMAAKHNLVTDDMNVHHENAHEFATKHGADDETAKTLVSMIHECEKANAGVPDDCDRTLEISKCFRTKIHELKWAPDMQVIVEELLTEV